MDGTRDPDSNRIRPLPPFEIARSPVGGAIAEKDPLWLLGLIWSLSALVVWIATTRVLLRRWRRRQRVIPALIIGELAALLAPASFLAIVPVGLVRRRRRKRL